LGNPSDGFFGRALSVAVRDFSATVTLEESADLRIEPGPTDVEVFESLDHLARAVALEGYYGGRRLIKAAIKTFHSSCGTEGVRLPSRNFTARYDTSVPRQVGLGGSSAIVTAAVRALMVFYGVDIPREVQPGLILAAEVDELGITAGLQDRVVQVYEGLVYMDFDRRVMEEHGHGSYQPLDPDLLPRIFLAHQAGPAKVSGRVLNGLKNRWEEGDPEARETLAAIADLAVEGKAALLERDHDRFSALMNRNFDLRRRIMTVSEGDLAMVEAARGVGASAKLAGSGGAVIGIAHTETVMREVAGVLGALGARVLEPDTGSST
jgi:glucuronokinase